MSLFTLILAFLLAVNLSWAQPTSTSAPQPAFQPQDGPATASPTYIPHVTYGYADAYGPIAPYYPNGYPVQPPPYWASLIPNAQGALQTALRLFTKVGFFLVGGVALLAVGGIFTTIVCSLTPFCTITFAGFGGLDQDTMRALVSPEKISTAAAIVQDAIGKYQRLQRAVNNH